MQVWAAAVDADKRSGPSHSQDRVDPGGCLVHRPCLKDGSHLRPQPPDGFKMALVDPWNSVQVRAIKEILDQVYVESFGPVDDVFTVYERDRQFQRQVFVMRELHLTYYLPPV